MYPQAGEQGALLAAPASAPRQVESPDVAEPVAQVLLDTPLPQLDRTFDYLVPAELDVQAQVGTRVVVRFGARQTHGWVWGRSATTTHRGRLSPLRRVVSDLPVLTTQTMRLVEAVAARSAGNRADVARLAVPARHRGAERSERGRPPVALPQWQAPSPKGWQDYLGGPEMLTALSGRGAPRAGWHVLPNPPSGAHWLDLVATAVMATLSGDRGVLVVMATHRQSQQAASRLAELLPGEPVVHLSAELGPAARYRAFTRLLLGRARVVVGTRAAAYAPVPDLGLAVLWDDGDNRLDDRRAPYTHCRQVLTVRSALERTGVLLAGHTRTVETQALIDSGWAAELRPPRALELAHRPRVEVPDVFELEAEGPSGGARIPSLAHRAARQALGAGPVLVQVPRGGYVPVVACDSCREAAHCAHCGGPLSMPRGGQTACRWCARPVGQWQCPGCGGKRLRMVSVGTSRTAEELGRAFPGTPVVVSGAQAEHGVIEEVDEAPRLVVATPGAEPHAQVGYACVRRCAAGPTRPRWQRLTRVCSCWDGLTLRAPRPLCVGTSPRWPAPSWPNEPGCTCPRLGGPPGWTGPGQRLRRCWMSYGQQDMRRWGPRRLQGRRGPGPRGRAGRWYAPQRPRDVRWLSCYARSQSSAPWTSCLRSGWRWTPPFCGETAVE